jgi:uncharacterized UBP type Zn finger protein
LTWSENCTIAPCGFIKAVKKVAILKKSLIFSGSEQNDIHEFLLFLSLNQAFSFINSSFSQ